MSSGSGSHKLVLLGETFVGKSSLVLRFVRGQFKESLESTVGAAFMTQTVMTMGKTIKFEIWDTAGQERYRSLAPMYYRGAKAAIVIYDITSYESYECAKSWIDELRMKTPNTEIIVLVGNKLDLQDFRKVSTSESEEYAKDQGLMFMEISVKDSINTNEVFIEIAKLLPPSYETRGNLENFKAQSEVQSPKQDSALSESKCFC